MIPAEQIDQALGKGARVRTGRGDLLPYYFPSDSDRPVASRAASSPT